MSKSQNLSVLDVKMAFDYKSPLYTRGFYFGKIANMIDNLQIETSQSIKDLWPEVGSIFVDLVPTERSEFGDLTTTIALKLAKELKLSPRDVAEKIQTNLIAKQIDGIDKIEIAGPGYINFTFANHYLEWQIAEPSASLTEEEALGWPKKRNSNNKRVIIEYPSTNIAKSMHVGHSRTCFIGDSLARIYEFAGFDVVRWDYIGDWGTNFGKIIAGYKKWGDESKLKARPIETMLEIYVRYSTEAKNNPLMEEEARAEFAKLENDDSENLKLWQFFKEEGLKESHRIYEKLGLLPSHVEIGESFYNKRASEIADDLLEKKIAVKSEGATVVKFENDKLPVALIEKSDGSTLYLSRDIPNILYRIAEYSPAKILYVVSNEQALHFEQLFEIVAMLGVDRDVLSHIKFGLILGSDHKKLSSRDGSAVLLEDILKETVSRAREIVKKKNTDMTDDMIDRVANIVAVGALKYNDLKEYRTGDIVFDWDKILDFGGNSGPYLQYTYARLKSILNKNEIDFSKAHSHISNSYERDIVVHLTRFDMALDRALTDNAPSYLALYAYELAVKLNSFYEHVAIIKEDNEDIRNSKLKLIRVSLSYLKTALNLLGIDVADRI